jgi:hypothetical protein
MRAGVANSFSLPLALLLGTLPGGLLAAVGDIWRRRALAHTGFASGRMGRFLGASFCEYYVVGLMLAVLLLVSVEAILRASPAARHAWGWRRQLGGLAIVAVGIFCGAGGLGRSAGIGSLGLLAGPGPAYAVYWWLTRNGRWPVRNSRAAKRGLRQGKPVK